jgi:propanediol dehydratase small subunit
MPEVIDFNRERTARLTARVKKPVAIRLYGIIRPYRAGSDAAL